MKKRQNGKVLLILIAIVAVAGGGGAVLLHLHGAGPMLDHLHQLPHAMPSAGNSESDAADLERVRDGVAAIGKRWDAEALASTVALYTSVHRELEWPGLQAPETFSYGAGPDQSFELFLPEHEFSEPGPVFLFVPGDGLGSRDWQIPGSEGLLLAHAGKFAATSGGIGVLMRYRPGSAGPEDLRLVVDWIKANIAPYGGDPDTIVAIAHSEGAAVTANYLFDETVQPESGHGLAVAFLSSGTFESGAAGIASLVDRYAGQPVPLSLWLAEYDTNAVEAGMTALHQRLCERYPVCPSLVHLEGHNHMSQIFSLGTADTSVFNQFVRFYHTVR